MNATICDNLSPGHGEKITRKQEAAISALLSEPSIAQAAKKAGVSAGTLRNWLKDENFHAAWLAARRAVVSQAVTRIQSACGEAVETLRTVMVDGESPAGSRVSAARTVLETAIKAVELEDLATRVQALEAVIGKSG